MTNPLDAMAQAAFRVSGFPKNRVLGMAGVLDSARMSTFVAMECESAWRMCTRLCWADMATIWCHCHGTRRWRGFLCLICCRRRKIDAIVDRTRKGGAEIVNLLKTGSAYYAPSASAVEMVEAILKDKKKILPCAVIWKANTGSRDCLWGAGEVGSQGAEEIIQIKLTPEENAALQKSAASVKELVGVLGI